MAFNVPFSSHVLLNWCLESIKTQFKQHVGGPPSFSSRLSAECRCARTLHSLLLKRPKATLCHDAVPFPLAFMFYVLKQFLDINHMKLKRKQHLVSNYTSVVLTFISKKLRTWSLYSSDSSSTVKTPLPQTSDLKCWAIGRMFSMTTEHKSSFVIYDRN